jgi:hypothetical protein
MAIPIPTGRKFTTTVTGSALKPTRCEQCGQEYTYLVTRSAQGEGSAPFFTDTDVALDHSSAVAEALLHQALESAFDPAPCPSCGWLQSYMVPVAKRYRYHHLRGLAKVCLFAGAVALLMVALITSGFQPQPDLPLPLFLLLCAGWVVAVVGLLAAPACLIAKWVLTRRYDPNSEDEEARKRLGESRALTPEQVAQFLEESKARLLGRLVRGDR